MEDDQTRESNRIQGLGSNDPEETQVVVEPQNDGANGSRSPDKRERTSSSSKDDEETNPEEKSGFGLRKLIRTADQNKWSMEEELAQHFINHTKLHIPDADMKLNLEDFPVPDNISCVPLMDTTFKNLLKKEGKALVVDQDQDWETVQQKLQDVMGPLGAAWNQCALYKRGDEVHLDLFNLASTLELSTLALANAIQKISWFRRVHSLSALGSLKNVRETLRSPKVQEILEKDTSNSLIPKDFDEHLKGEKGTRQNLINHFKPPEEKKKKKETATTAKGKKDRRYATQQPFPGAPSGRGGGYSSGGYANKGGRDSYYAKNPYSERRYDGKKHQGKHVYNPCSGQHAFDSSLADVSRTCSSKFEGHFPNSGNCSSTGRKDSKIPDQLEVTHQRPGNIGHSKGMGNTSPGHPNPNKDSSRCENELSRETSHGQGDRKHAVQRGNQGSNPKKGSVHQQRFCNPERGRTVPPHNKSEEVKRVCPIPPFQDGGAEGCQTPVKPGGLDVQNRSERCILLSPPGDSIQKMGPIQLERETLRVPMPSLRLRASPENLHKNDESSCGSTEEIRNSSCDLSRRHVDTRSLSGGGDQGKRHDHVPIPLSRIDDKYEEVSLTSLPGIGVSGGHSQQLNHDLLTVQRKETQIDFEVSGGLSEPFNLAKVPLFPDRKTVVDSGGCHAGPPPTEISPTIVHKSTVSKTALRDNDQAFIRKHFGIKMVDGKSHLDSGKPHTSTTTRTDHLLGCSEDRGLGGSLPSWINRGTLVRGGEEPSHKHSRTNGGRTSNQNLHEGSYPEVYTHENRQHFGLILSGQHGGDQKSPYDQNCQKDLELSTFSSDHDYCRMDPIAPKRGSGLGVQKHFRLSRVEAVSSDVSICLSNDGSARDRPICIEDISPDPQVLQLEGGPGMPRSRCISTGLVSNLPLCISPFLPDNKSPATGKIPKSKENDSYNSFVADPTMVSPSHGNVSSNTATPPNIQKPSVKSIGSNSSTTSKLLSKAGGLASVRDRLRHAGVSESASGLIINSRRGGTATTYESAWKKWSLWCTQRHLDPITCPVNHILEYLSHLFALGTPYRTIGGHRSAISAYHNPIVVDSALVTAGRHPLVSALMSGVHNLRPPQARYSFTWDIEVVLCLFKSWPLDLTPKQLTQKVTTLLALIGVPRGAELHLFDLNYMADFDQKVVFELPGTVKNVREGKKPKPLEFHQHKGDNKLCPVKCIQKYINLTEPWRTGGSPSNFFLSFKAPHKPVCKSTLARWIKDVLFQANVDKVFSAHSLRGASTSKALLKGLTVKEVVDHGKWSLESTWQRFYHKEVKSASKKYQDSILEL